MHGLTAETLTVEVPAAATIGQLKDQIAELYGVPVCEQRLQASARPGDACFGDSVPVAWAARLGQLHLVPGHKDSDTGSEAGVVEGLEVLQQAQATVHEVAQSVQGATYHVHVSCPLMGSSLGESPSLTLEVEALCLVGDLLSESVKELFGDIAGLCPLVLSAEGRALPSDLPLHFVGVRDGDTLLLTQPFPLQGDSEDDGDDTDSESFDDYMQAWAAR